MLPEPALRMLGVVEHAGPGIRPNGIALIKNETTAQMAVSLSIRIKHPFAPSS